MRNRHFFLVDLVMLPVAAYLAFVLRLDTFRLGSFWPEAIGFGLLSVTLAPPVFYVLGLYSRYWRYASVNELSLILRTLVLMVGLVTVAGIALASNGVFGFTTLPRSVPFIFLLLAVGVVATPRFFTRLAASSDSEREDERGRRTLIVGAGDAGTLAARELQRNPQVGMWPTGFLDDDAEKQGTLILGIPVLATRDDLVQVVNDHAIEDVIIAMPTVPGRIVREVVAACDQVNITPKIVPGLYQLLDGKLNINQLRTVEIDDLLRREPVQTNLEAVENVFKGRRVLVTGAGGSIGSELCRQILGFQPSDLVLLGHGENSIFQIHNELLRRQRSSGLTSTHIQPVIADVRFGSSVRAVFSRYQPQIVIHACAHKHVPLMEHNPSEAIYNNVVGTRQVLEAAKAANVERFVFVSTDKAVNPTSIMGASKRAAELLVHRAASEAEGAYIVVRFGNVLGSSGSVVLTMRQQIAAGGPVTVTHPDMTRYFMTIPEAVQLTLQAAELSRGDEVLMFDMGEPVRIVDLAYDLIRLSGLEVGEDIDVVFSGPRPGEKLSEELFLPSEQYHRTSHEKIFVAVHTEDDPRIHVPQLVDELARAARSGDDRLVRRALEKLIPEYQPDKSLNPVSEPTTAASAGAPSERNESTPPNAVPGIPATGGESGAS